MTAELSAPPTAETVANLPEVLSTEQAAWLLQVSTYVLMSAVRAGKITAREVEHRVTPGRVERRHVFSKSDLLEMFGTPSTR